MFLIPNIEEDARRLATLHSICFPNSLEAYSEYLFLEMLRTPSYSFSLYGAHGFGIVRSGKADAEIITIAVHPKKRRNGLGQKILNDLIKKVIYESKPEIFLEVATENTAAIKLYKKCGFKKINLRIRYFKKKDGSKSDAVLMRKILTF